jgi:4-amino-4-deoxy-L-arabinose transferase-like glycosyltransferase
MGDPSHGMQEQPGIQHLHPASRFLQFVIVAVALALFLALSLKNITLPGLYYDEALDVVPTAQMLQGMPVDAVRGSGLAIGDRTFPLMVMDYVGTVNTYLALPVFALFGADVRSVRLLPIVLAALSLALGYLLALRLFDWRVAGVATLLLAVDPSYVFFSRMGIHVTSAMTVFSLGSLLALLHWEDTASRRWLLLGGLLLGLGLWAKVLFAYWIVALAVAWACRRLLPADGKRALSTPTLILHSDRSDRLRPGAIVLAGIALGSAPLWIYNLQTGGTLAAFGRNALITEHGVSNLNVVANVVAALASLRTLLDGSYFWFMGASFANPLNVIVLVAAVLACLALLRRRPQWRGGSALTGVLLAAIVAESAFTVSGIWATHLYILFPLPQMVIALGVVLLADNLAPRRLWLQWAVIGVVLAAGMTANVRTDMAYHAAVQRSGGLSRFSDAVYKLADWLDAQDNRAIYALDWGIAKNVSILTQGRVNPIEVFGYAGSSPEELDRRLEQALSDRTALYVLHSREDTVFELYQRFAAAAQRVGVSPQIIEAFSDKSGAPVYVMWDTK